MKTEATSLTMSRRMTASIRRTSSTKLRSSSRALRTFTEQSHDEVRGCFKGGSGKGGRKSIHISIAPSFYLTTKHGAPHGATRYGDLPTGDAPGIRSIRNINLAQEVIILLAEHWEHSRRVNINKTQGLSFLHIR
ncbi:hypothetical protein Tco_1384774 [Tanacetum coccineum]